MKRIRELKTGEAFGRFVNDDRLYPLKVHYDPVIETARLEGRYQELLARNFEQDFFISAVEADRLAEIDRQRLLAPGRIALDSQTTKPSAETHDDPFR